jgi:hypothetical protein
MIYMIKRKFKPLTERITNSVIAKELTIQVVGGITDPNDDNDPPEDPDDGSDLAGTDNDTRHNSTSQGANTSTRS